MRTIFGTMACDLSLLRAGIFLNLVVACGPDADVVNRAIVPKVAASGTAAVNSDIARGARLAKRIALPSSLPQEGACARNTDSLSVRELSADSDRLYIALVHDAAANIDSRHPSEHIDASLLVDGCPHTPPRVNGMMAYDWKEGSVANISLTSLPDGELDLVFSAFGQLTELQLMKRGREITHLRLEDRKGYRLIPGDRETGSFATAVFSDPDCNAKSGAKTL
jgi:hypothetical protein